MKKVKNNTYKKDICHLVNENRNKIYKTAKTILKNEQDICFAIQETILYSYKELKECGFENKNDFFIWFLSSLIRKCYEINKLKEKSDKPNNKNELKYKETYLDKVLDRLEDDQKIIAVLYYYNDLEIDKISKVLDIPEEIIKSSMTRIRMNLYKLLKKGGEFYVK